MMELVVLTEEPSAKDLLEGLLPRLLPDSWAFRCINFEGKQDLEKRMGRTLRAWQNRDARFVVLRDQDSGDCHAIKAGLIGRCLEAGKPNTLVRIACRDLEAWVLGDLSAFSREFSVPAAEKASGKAKYRDPDNLGSAMQELRRFVPTYQKRDGAKRMGRRLDPGRNTSHSFRVFCAGISKMLA